MCGMSYSDDRIRVSKSTKNVKKVILFTKNWNKMVEKEGVFNGMRHKKGVYFSTLGPLN